MRLHQVSFLILLSLFIGDAKAGGGGGFGTPAITPTFLPPVTDGGGNVIKGTELVSLVSHSDSTGPHIFAANGYWLDTTEALTTGAQVFHFDSTRGAPTQDIQFPAGEQVAQSMIELSVAADYAGAVISPPQTLLLAGSKTINLSSGAAATNANIHMRNDIGGTYLGTWTNFVIDSPVLAAGRHAEIRSLGYHTDTVTGVGHIFAGIDPCSTTACGGATNALAAIWSGGFDTVAKTIHWDTTPEFALFTPPVIGPSTPNQSFRFMAFAECNGKEYATNFFQIFQYNDGAESWSLFATEGLISPHYSASGYRGISCVTGSDGVTDELLMTTEGDVAWAVAWNTCTLPCSPVETSEFHITSDLYSELQLPGEVTYVIASYNNIAKFGVNYLIGGEAKLGGPPPPVYVPPGVQYQTIPNERTHFANAFFYHRTNTGTKWSFHYLPALFAGSSAAYPSTSARVFLPSPFPGDNGVVFVGGYDANTDNQVAYILASQPTAWIYRIQTDSDLAFSYPSAP